MNETKTIRGHVCEGLMRFLEAVTYQCIPTINDVGQIQGCDDSNPVLIEFCPWCGTKLELTS